VARKKKETIDNEPVDDLNKFFKDSLGSQELDDVEKFISTGSTLLDYSISNKKDGGIPIGRVTEICGNEATGKSLLAYHILSNTQKKDGVAIYIDTERSGNKEFMTRMGIDWEKLIYVKDLQCIEDVFDYIEKVAKITRLKIPDKDKPVTIVWDSVASTPPKDFLEADYDKAGIGIAARAMSRGLSKLNEALDSGFITLVCINQLRVKIGTLFGDPETTPHGKALPFYSSVRIKLSGTKKVLDKTKDNRVVGVVCTAKVFKNKVGPNWRSAVFPLMYDYGVNNVQSILEYLCDIEIVSGTAWKKIEVDGEEHKFQNATWRETYNKPKVRNFINKILEENLVIKFLGMPDDIKIDSDSFMEIEQLKQDMEEK
jgi:recombination protein RecA